MMKKLNYLILGLAGLTLASCSNDDLLGPAKGDGNVNFKVSLPGMGTRALGDGSVSLDLQYAVYEAETDAQGNPQLGTCVIESSGNFTVQDPYNTTVSMNLAAGKSYYVAFFAQKADNYVYNFDTENAQLKVDYSKMNSTDNLADAYDCFYQIYPTGKISGTSNFNVTLYRPVAQINWGTNDLTEANQELQNTFGTTGQWIKTNLTVTVPNTMDFLTKEVSGEAEIELNAFAAPQDEAFPVGQIGEYQYVAVQYLLAPQDQTVYDLNLNINNTGNTAITQSTNDVVVSNAPVQANYRTNIYGSLLSNNVEFNVTKGPWEGMYDIMQGESQPEVENGAYQITNQAELTWIANQVNSGNFDNKPIELQNDIYMTGDWTPIGTGFANRFNGTFNGNNHTIYNLNVNVKEMGGFFGFMNGQVNNLNFKNAYVFSNHYAGVVAGYSDNETGTAKINKCSVSDSKVILTAEQVSTNTWDNGDKGGMIIGYMVTDYVENCTVTNCILQGYRDLGGIIGYANGSYVNNNKVDGLTIYLDKGHNYKTYSDESDFDANGVIGEDHSKSNTGNTSSNVTVHSNTVLAETMAIASYAGAAGENIIMVKNLPDDASTSGYGGNVSGINLYGGILYGNGYTVEVEGANGTYDCAVHTNGGTVKDLTVVDGFRSIFVNSMVTDLYIDNCDLYPQAYPININEAAKVEGLSMYVTNTKLRGWLSYNGNLKSANFTTCEFVTTGNYDYIRPYRTTYFENCTFGNGWTLNIDNLKAGETINFSNCNVGGTMITSENYQSLLTIVTTDSQNADELILFNNN